MRRGCWKELHFTRREEHQRWASALQSNRRAFIPGVYWSLESGPSVIVTNMSEGDMRRIARIDGLREPEYVRLADDDPIVLELTAKS